MKLARDVAAHAAWRALETDLVLHERAATRRFALTGTGRVECLQGLVTCDVTKTGDRSHLFGALLTPKGMIAAPLWITLRDDSILLETPLAAADRLLDTLARSLPPRLCRAVEVTASSAAFGVYGPAASEALGMDARAVPAVARGARGLDLIVPNVEADAHRARLIAAGGVAAPDEVLEACRILAGIPALGAEIDERTLPQEVRYEELGAVSYTKGCYVGQETVARLHFRGHTNRRLALIVLDAEPETVPLDVTLESRTVGRLTSACWTDELDAWVAQAVLRREVTDGAEVRAGGVPGVVRLDRWVREP